MLNWSDWPPIGDHADIAGDGGDPKAPHVGFTVDVAKGGFGLRQEIGKRDLAPSLRLCDSLTHQFQSGAVLQGEIDGPVKRQCLVAQF